MPTLVDLERFVGRPVAPTEALVHIETVTALVRAYTRGRGFTDGTPEPEVDAVILTATARLITNPTANITETIGEFTTRPSVFNGFNLVETLVLNNYRRRAA